mmetsp:Transcript_28600/g.40950  ORF Transcript_28600/g.40950 Transcript_28600/m.40950 type:complete len:81 (+) Transcript_28600:490-732(+)
MKLKFEVQQKKCSQVYLLVCTAQAGICWIDQGTRCNDSVHIYVRKKINSNVIEKNIDETCVHPQGCYSSLDDRSGHNNKA